MEKVKKAAHGLEPAPYPLHTNTHPRTASSVTNTTSQ